MRLGICDDNERDREMIYQISKDVVSGTGIDCEIISYQNGSVMLGSMAEVDLLILDIEMPGMSGLEIKQRLQNLGTDTVIIFVTNHVELMPSAFGIHVYGLVAKKNLEEQLPEMLASALEMLGQYMILEDGVDSRDVLYIRSARIYSDLYLADGTKKVTRISLEHYAQMLSGVGFVRTHRTYVVNLKWVEDITARGARIGEELIPISTRLRNEVRDRYVRYCLKNGRYC